MPIEPLKDGHQGTQFIFLILFLLYFDIINLQYMRNIVY